ncbi:four-carbon acid sugar kinase family protein [Sporomusa sp.]|uniref:four-carbon acid sugar kinase family protein n=1 Tax=Sporomusa sp. TaxID=2078658 RepID=UPI002B808D1E|nr:four-carbon acid sugar kinase family protein [Sporomusa sp.]HWR42089.1 four-carbon acid sugar kinase family protein [Sporomusa sp.]
MPKIAVIADDLTGANDTGVQFSKFGLRTTVLLDAIRQNLLPHHTDVVVLDTDSRAVLSSVASDRVSSICQMLQEQDVDSLYKKIDSTLRGNISAEVLSAYQEFKPVITIIAPAYPQTRRVTVGGYQLLEGLPISMTEVARDPQRPVPEAWLPKLLKAGTGREVGAVPLHIVMEGVAKIQDEISRYLSRGVDWLVFDAVCDENLRHIVEAALPYQKILWVGSAGLAEHIPGVFGWSNDDQKILPLNCTSVLVAAGSVSTVTQKQIQHYVEQTAALNLMVNAVAAVLTPADEIKRIVAAAVPFLKQRDLVLSCSNNRQVIQEAIEAGKSIALDASQVGAQIASVLSSVVENLVKLGVDGLFLTGGETAVNCCRALGASGIEIVREVAAGIPLGCLAGGSFAGLPVVTKAGAFGEFDAITKAVGALKGKEE